MIFDTVADMIADKNGTDRTEITTETRFIDIGVDSIDLADLMVGLEDEIGEEIELEQRVETVGELVKYIESKLGKQ